MTDPRRAWRPLLGALALVLLVGCGQGDYTDPRLGVRCEVSSECGPILYCLDRPGPRVCSLRCDTDGDCGPIGPVGDVVVCTPHAEGERAICAFRWVVEPLY